MLPCCLLTNSFLRASAQWHLGRGRKNAPTKEAVVKIVDDIYRLAFMLFSTLQLPLLPSLCSRFTGIGNWVIMASIHCHSRKMQVHGPPDLVSHNQLVPPDYNRILIKAKKEQDPSSHLGPSSGCLCGQSFVLGNVVKVCCSSRLLYHSSCPSLPVCVEKNDSIFCMYLIIPVFASSSSVMIAKCSSTWTACSFQRSLHWVWDLKLQHISIVSCAD